MNRQHPFVAALLRHAAFVVRFAASIMRDRPRVSAKPLPRVRLDLMTPDLQLGLADHLTLDAAWAAVATQTTGRPVNLVRGEA